MARYATHRLDRALPARRSRSPTTRSRKRFAHLPEFVDKMEAVDRHPDPLLDAPRTGRRPTSRCRPRGRRSSGPGGGPRTSTSSSSAPTRPTTSRRRPRSCSSTSSARRTPGRSTSAAPARRSRPGSPPPPGSSPTNPAMKTVLVVGVYLMHKLADPNDPMIFFYGDGAGAAVLEPADEPGFVASAFQADGAYAKHWGIYAGGTAEPATVEAVRAGRTTVQDGRALPARDQPRGVAAARPAARRATAASPSRRHRLRRSSPRCASPPSSW